MDMKTFQERTRETAVYQEVTKDARDRTMYCILGVNDEAGEVAGAYKKYMRGDYPQQEALNRVRKEAADTLWYLARLFDELDLDMGIEAEALLQRLAKRKVEGLVRGDGSDR
jgi:NTP pyrophosphatase (non-canonical NTP hydrolase)